MPKISEIERLAELARQQIESDEQYARERQEAYETKKQWRIYQTISELVQKLYGKVIPDVIDQVRRLLPEDWFH